MEDRKAAALVGAARVRQEIGVEQAAIRCGRSVSEFVAIETGTLGLSADELRDVLLVLGEQLVVHAGESGTRPLDGAHDPEQIAQMRNQPAEWRLEHALGWNRFADELYLAGKSARGE